MPARAHAHDPIEVRRAIADRLLPSAPYVLEDGTEHLAPDYFELAHLAGSRGTARVVRASLRRGRGAQAGSAQKQWQEYLTGIYAVCLRAVTPAAIVAKGELMDTIERLTAEPAPEDDVWRVELTAAAKAVAPTRR